VVWSLEARRKLLPRRSGVGPLASRVYKRGLLAEFNDLCKRWSLDPDELSPSARAMAPWREMRRLLADASADAFSEARDEAARFRTGAPLELRCAIAFAFPTDASFCLDDAEACLKKTTAGGPPSAASLLFSTSLPAEILERLIRAYPSGFERAAIGSHAIEFVESLGPGAAPLIELLFNEAEQSRDTRGASRCVEAMELLRSDEAAAFFARHLDANEARPAAVRFFRDAPDLAILALSPLATGRGKAAEAAKTILHAAIATSPTLADELLPELDDAGKRGLRAALGRAEVASEEASLSDLPPLLARPPWRFKDGTRPRVIEDLLVVEVRVPIDPAVHSRDAWAAKLHWVPNSLVFSARVALPVAHAWIHKREVRDVADAWLDAFPALAAAGLIPAAVGKLSVARIDAGRILRMLAKRGHDDVIRRAAALYGTAVAEAVAEVLALDPLRDCPDSPPKLGDFLHVEALPRPRLAKSPDKVLPLKAVEAICEMLAFTSDDFPYAGIDIVRDACEPASLSDLAWAIFSAWLTAGGSLKQPWPMAALGAIGGDAAARKLAPKIRAWPGEKATARAEAGLDVLARIGTDVALMHLASIAERVRYPELKARARAKIAAVAQARGLSLDELGDRLIPDLDLDPDGSKVLDYGARSFRVGFDEHLDPFVRDGAGAVLRSLPKPSKADDADKAKAAQAAWKGLRDDVETIARSVIGRLELAMASRRRWGAPVFRGLLVAHPLLIHLVTRLVWGVYDACGNVVATFRVAEDRTFAGADDAPFDLAESSAVGIPHPLELSDELRRAWGSVLSDYELLQPFPQLGREVYTPTPEELDASVLTRVMGVTIPSGKLFGLEYRGFRRDPDGSGRIRLFWKDLTGGQFSVQLAFSPGMHPLRVGDTPEQTLGPVTLYKSTAVYSQPSFRELDAIVFSELVRDIEMLRR
jgi:hypothetical protein